MKYYLKSCGKIVTTREHDVVCEADNIEDLRGRQRVCFSENNNKGRYWV